MSLGALQRLEDEAELMLSILYHNLSTHIA
jgi:hypothetical protein